MIASSGPARPETPIDGAQLLIPAPTLPLVSIVTPSYNQGHFIRQTIESVLGQDYPNIEYWVVDGGSTDETLAILREYAGDPRFHWMSEPDGGQGDAINKGVRLTHGELLAWLNADDIYLPGALSRAVQALQDHSEAALIYGHAALIDREGAVVEACAYVEPFSLNRLIHYGDFIMQPAAFFRRGPFLEVGGLNPSLHYSLDYDLWIKLALRYPVHYLPQELARARIYPETKTASGGLDRLDELERMIQPYGRRRLPALFYGVMLKACLQAARRALASGEWARAWTRGRQAAGYAVALAYRTLRYGRQGYRSGVQTGAESRQ
jgi:glycosyltransferase involved in cell wall biosynthesis